MITEEKITALLSKFDALEQDMSTASGSEEIIRLSKEHGELKPIADHARELAEVRRQIGDLKELAAGDDPEMAELAAMELEELEARAPGLEHELQLLLLPKDKADDSSVILEVRAGTGGDEAALFAGDLFRMYQRYALLQGWRVEILSQSDADVGGYKEIQANIAGDGVLPG